MGILWYVFDNLVKEASFVKKMLETWKKPSIPSAIHSYDSLFYFCKYLGKDWIKIAVFFWLRNTADAKQTIRGKADEENKGAAGHKKEEEPEVGAWVRNGDGYEVRGYGTNGHFKELKGFKCLAE